MFVSEAIEDVLRPKSKNEIDEAKNRLFHLKEISDKLSLHRGKLFILYIYETDFNVFEHMMNEEKVYKRLCEEVFEAFENDWTRKIVVLSLDPKQDGLFTDEGRSVYVRGGTNFVCEIDLKESMEGRADVSVNLGKHARGK